VAFTFDKQSLAARAGEVLARAAGELLPNARLQGVKSAPGVSGEGLRFLQANDHAAAGVPRALEKPCDLTVAAWVRISELRNSNYVVASEDWERGAIRGFVLRVSEEGRPELTIGRGEWGSVRGEPISLNEWHHLAGTASEKALTLWVDGEQVGSVKSGGRFSPSPHGLSIGRGNYDPLRGFLGVIDEVVLYSRALGKDEVSALFRLGKEGKPLASGRLAPEVWPAGLKPFFTEAVTADPKVRVAPGKRPVVVIATLRGYELFTGTVEKLDVSKVLGRPVPGNRNTLGIPSFDFACDEGGNTHIVTHIDSKPGHFAGHYTRVSPAGEVLVPWMDLNAKLGFDSLAEPPAILRVEPDELRIFCTGTSKDAKAALVAAGIEERGLRKLEVHSKPSESFAHGIKHAYVVGASRAQPWVLTEVGNDFVWLNPQSGTTAPCAAGVAVELLHGYFAAHVAKDGTAYLVIREPNTAQEGAAKTNRLRIHRGRAGAKLGSTVLEGAFTEYVSPVIAESPGGKVVLFAAVVDRSNPFKKPSRTDAWDIAGKEPHRLGSVVLGFSNAGGAAFADETTVFFVVKGGLQNPLRGAELWSWTIGG